MFKAKLIHFAHLLKAQLQMRRAFSGRGVLLRIANRILSAPRTAMTIETLYGFKMHIDPVNDNGVEKSIYFTGTYEAGTLHIFDQLLKPGDTFFDIGSNIGLMAIFAAKKVGKAGQVHCFEPQPNTFQILEKNCSINKLTNITLNNFALGRVEGAGVIYANMNINRGAASLVMRDHTNGHPVKIATLDQYMSRSNATEIALMKIDIEGYEIEMLNGARLLLSSSAAPMLCVEYSELVTSMKADQDIYDFIRSINQYRIFKFVGSKGEVGKLTEVFNKKDMPVHDNIFCFLPRHLLRVDPKIFA